MVDKMETLKREISRTINALQPGQQFSIVFFSEGKPATFEGGALVDANPQNLSRAQKWVADVISAGQTEPIPGLELAFKGTPDLLYLLTDGDFDDESAVLTRLAQLNASKKTRVNTIGLVSANQDEISDLFIRFLNRAARENGGVSKLIAVNELE